MSHDFWFAGSYRYRGGHSRYESSYHRDRSNDRHRDRKTSPENAAATNTAAEGDAKSAGKEKDVLTLEKIKVSDYLI